jgi:hypothetical protein
MYRLNSLRIVVLQVTLNFLAKEYLGQSQAGTLRKSWGAWGDTCCKTGVCVEQKGCV